MRSYPSVTLGELGSPCTALQGTGKVCCCRAADALAPGDHKPRESDHVIINAAAPQLPCCVRVQNRIAVSSRADLGSTFAVLNVLADLYASSGGTMHAAPSWTAGVSVRHAAAWSLVYSCVASVLCGREHLARRTLRSHEGGGGRVLAAAPVVRCAAASPPQHWPASVAISMCCALTKAFLPRQARRAPVAEVCRCLHPAPALPRGSC